MENVKEHRNILLAMTIINLLVLWNFISEDKIKHGIGYFVFFYIALFVIHFFTNKFPPKIDIEVKQPKRELAIITLFSVLGAIFITLNFYLKANTEQIGFLVRLPILLGIFFFTFPLGIVIYLFFKKYKLLQLGLKTKPLSHLLLGLIVWGLTGLFAYIFNKSGILWAEAYAELGGVSGMILQGVIGAGLVEEFSRFVMQSRFERVFKRFGFNILFATTIWAFMHFPVTYFRGTNISETLIYCIQIIPIGFIWGYLTHRSRSIVPATIVHGLNLWGFQNG